MLFFFKEELLSSKFKGWSDEPHVLTWNCLWYAEIYFNWFGLIYCTVTFSFFVLFFFFFTMKNWKKRDKFYKTGIKKKYQSGTRKFKVLESVLKINNILLKQILQNWYQKKYHSETSIDIKSIRIGIENEW